MSGVGPTPSTGAPGPFDPTPPAAPPAADADARGAAPAPAEAAALARSGRAEGGLRPVLDGLGAWHTHGRTMTTIGGKQLRDAEWQAQKHEHVDRIYEFGQRYDSVAFSFMSILSDINFARGVYARSEVMSLVNDYLAPLDAEGKSKSEAWARYIDAHERGASELELARIFFDAHNEALDAAVADPRYQEARASSDPRHVVLNDVTLGIAHDMEAALAEPDADPHRILNSGVRQFMQAHREAGVVPISMSDLELVARAVNLNPIEAMLDRIKGESTDEALMRRGLRSLVQVQQSYLQSRLDGVRDVLRRLTPPFGR